MNLNKIDQNIIYKFDKNDQYSDDDHIQKIPKKEHLNIGEFLKKNIQHNEKGVRGIFRKPSFDSGALNRRTNNY